MGRPVSVPSQIAYWCLDAQVFIEIGMDAYRSGNPRKGALCLELASTAASLAAGKAETLKVK